MNKLRRKPVVGLALGSGSARGWAHFGVLRALREAGISPDIICGTSIGSLVGATYAAGEMDAFESWVLGLGKRKVFGFMDFNLGGGLLKGEKIIEFWRQNFVQETVEELGTPFGCVATDLQTGAEVWLRKGSIAEAVRASIALPGLFTPVMREGRLLVDGGLVNPVPVSLARAMGADIVIAVDLNADIMRRHMRSADMSENELRVHGSDPRISPLHADVEEPPLPLGQIPEVLAANGSAAGWTGAFKRSMTGVRMLSSTVMRRARKGEGFDGEEDTTPVPSLVNVLMASVNIMQMRITRSRMAGDPAEVLIAPRLSHVGLMDFYRGRESIDEGYAATQLALPALKDWGL
ncbi:MULTISPECIES: patatin-like phospholipase family protein [Comamonas]|uniref:patatin-like phospholipase family protein n=1 Tax=Comamonas TaxID=283 RepID=UPI0012D2544B|nr:MULTISPECIES: patatin-like phospholipase family protein [Comamonas]MEB5967124.1 patatin-like phospholipase family protein [Comamonas testosteroni]MPS92548.1 patatin [Comamonas sp.]